jgi:hypothetical protein
MLRVLRTKRGADEKSPMWWFHMGLLRWRIRAAF